MSFLDTVLRAKTYLEGQGRVWLGALKLEFDLDDARLDISRSQQARSLELRAATSLARLARPANGRMGGRDR